MEVAKCFVKQDNRFSIATKNSVCTYDELPASTYAVKFNPMSGYYLEIVTDFILPKKVYGNHSNQADRILNTFHNRPASTGTLLSGEKGSGKTMLAKLICAQAAAKYSMPTLLVNNAFHGDDFNTFLNSIQQKSIVLFDEFEKVYDRDDQQAILTIMDGVYSTQKLFILTCNNKHAIDSHMKNRPGRLFYFIEYKGLDYSFIQEYCELNLNNKEQIGNIQTIASLFKEFNFDMLQALVEEMNRYNETAPEAIKLLNCKPDNDNRNMYLINLTIDGVQITEKEILTPNVHTNPLEDSFCVEYLQGSKCLNNNNDNDDDEQDDDSKFLYVDPTLITKYKPETGEFTFVLEQHNAVVRLTKQKEEYFHFSSLLV